MLSINIPVYNVEVKELVREVARQAESAGINYEIRVYDDCSEEQIRGQNKQVAAIPCVVYREMPVNLGRSAIRNRMGNDSQNAYLLFIDADSQIDSVNYIHNYISTAVPGCVLCGGTKYVERKPDNPNQLLRWVYGRAREAISATERNSQKGFIITSNNFLIDRKVFQQVHFRENIGPYGHEDTLLGYDLFRNQIIPFHIDNPVVHTGLEDSYAFLAKTRKALENLLFIEHEVVDGGHIFREKVRFLKQYYKLTRLFPALFLRYIFYVFRNHLENNLTGKHPILKCLDFYKAGYYSLLIQRKRQC